jgi:hypothetical protein
VESLPGTWWVYYLALGIALIGAEVLLEWQLGIVPSDITRPYFFIIVTGIAYILAFVHYIDRAAKSALASFRPVLTVDSEAEYALLEYRLTTMPVLPTFVASLLGSAFVAIALLAGIVPFQILRPNAPTVWQWFNAALEIVLWFVIGMALYHTIRQLRLVRHIYDERTQINLFKLGPLYALSGLTARTAIGAAIVGYGAIVTGSQNINLAAGVGIASITSVLVLACFVVPLLGIHRRLVEEKQRVLGESMARLEKVMVETQRDVDSGRIDRASALDDQTNALRIQNEILQRIPAWPWQVETFRVLITALLLPVVLFLIQLVIQRLIVP